MCGLFGFLKYGSKKICLDSLTEALARESAVRGTDATGIAYNYKGSVTVYKKPVSAYRMNFKVPSVKALTGHTRHATQGAIKKNYNNHPFIGKAGNDKFALAHNGILTNDTALRNSLKLTKTKIETDSYIAVQLIESKKKLDMESISYMAENVQGSFSFSILDKDENIYLVKGDSPLSILHFPEKEIYVYASTTEILWKALVDTELFVELKKGGYKEVSVNDGEILKLLSNGKIEKGEFNYMDFVGYTDSWRYYGMSNLTDTADTTYYDDLVSVASGMGLTRSDIDELLAYGMTYDEIEDYIYYKSYYPDEEVEEQMSI